MNRRHTFDFRWLIVSLVVLSLACASTPDSRIKKQQSLFDS